MSEDQRSTSFKLREGLKFHNGDPFTAEDVKFSFQRAKAETAAPEGEGGRSRRSLLMCASCCTSHGRIS